MSTDGRIDGWKDGQTDEPITIVPFDLDRGTISPMKDIPQVAGTRSDQQKDRWKDGCPNICILMCLSHTKNKSAAGIA